MKVNKNPESPKKQNVMSNKKSLSEIIWQTIKTASINLEIKTIKVHKISLIVKLNKNEGFLIKKNAISYKKNLFKII